MGGAIRPPNFVTPGPGSYNLAGKRYQGGPRFQTSPNDVGFMSRGKRMGGESQEDLLKPGPGQYVVSSPYLSSFHLSSLSFSPFFSPPPCLSKIHLYARFASPCLLSFP